VTQSALPCVHDVWQGVSGQAAFQQVGCCSVTEAEKRSKTGDGGMLGDLIWRGQVRVDEVPQGLQWPVG
jgi:hypothetical protein